MQDFNLMRKNINKKFLRDFYEKNQKNQKNMLTVKKG